MSDKFQNTYRISSTRMQNWDYRWAGCYFITICTQNRENYFGKIVNGKMHYTPIGAIANVMYFEIKNHAKNIMLGEFVVMPNHVHGILILNNPYMPNDGIVKTRGDGYRGVDDVGYIDDGVHDGVVETRHALSLRMEKNIENPHQNPNEIRNENPNKNPIYPKNNQSTIGQKRFQNIGNNSISSIVGSYKSAVTKHANRLNLPFGWQERFHDHVIRDEKAFVRISNYIVKNPKNWKEDQFFN